MSEYFIKRGERISGPYSKARIKQLVADGKLKASDLISNRNDGGWKPAPRRPKRSPVAIPDLPPQGAARARAPKTGPQAPRRGHGLLLRSVAVVGIVLIPAALWLLWPSTPSTIGQTSSEAEATAANANDWPDLNPATGEAPLAPATPKVVTQQGNDLGEDPGSTKDNPRPPETPFPGEGNHIEDPDKLAHSVTDPVPDIPEKREGQNVDTTDLAETNAAHSVKKQLNFYIDPVVLNLTEDHVLTIGPDHESKLVRDLFFGLEFYLLARSVTDFKVDSECDLSNTEIRQAIDGHDAQYVEPVPTKNFNFSFTMAGERSNLSVNRRFEFVPEEITTDFEELLALELSSGIMHEVGKQVARLMFSKYNGQTKDKLQQYSYSLGSAKGNFHSTMKDVEILGNYFHMLKEWSKDTSEPINPRFDADVPRLIGNHIAIFRQDIGEITLSYSSRRENIEFIPNYENFVVKPGHIHNVHNDVQKRAAYRILKFLRDNPNRLNFDGKAEKKEGTFSLADIHNHLFRGSFSPHFGVVSIGSFFPKKAYGSDFSIGPSIVMGENKISSYRFNDFKLHLGESLTGETKMLIKLKPNNDSGEALMEVKLNNGDYAYFPYNSWMTGTVIQENEDPIMQISLGKVVKDRKTLSRHNPNGTKVVHQPLDGGAKNSRDFLELPELIKLYLDYANNPYISEFYQELLDSGLEITSNQIDSDNRLIIPMNSRDERYKKWQALTESIVFGDNKADQENSDLLNRRFGN